MEIPCPLASEETRPSASLTSDDLAPVAPAARTWGTWNYAALRISMSLCIPTYMLASSLIQGGMSWWQALLTIFLGNAIVLVPMMLNGRAGKRYGIPFPVFARASFGVLGANVPALLRAVIACGWFGIQTWIGGYACYQAAVRWWPVLGTLPPVFPAGWGLATGPAITFLLFWLLNMYVVYLGDLYQHEGRYTYRRSFNPVAIVALVLGIVPSVPGFLAAINVLDTAAVWPWLLEVYNYAWFVGFFVAGGVYWGLMQIGKLKLP